MKKNTILAVVAYIFPLVGLILWLVNRKKPEAAGKVYGIAALYGVGYYIIDTVLRNSGGTLLSIIGVILFFVGIVLVVKMTRKNAGTSLVAILKGWLVDMGDAMDRWLFKLTPESGNTIGNTFWASLVIGFSLVPSGRQFTCTTRCLSMADSRRLAQA